MGMRRRSFDVIGIRRIHFASVARRSQREFALELKQCTRMRRAERGKKFSSAVSRKLHSPALKRVEMEIDARSKNIRKEISICDASVRECDSKSSAMKNLGSAIEKNSNGRNAAPCTAHVLIAVARLACAGLGAHDAGGLGGDLPETCTSRRHSARMASRCANGGASEQPDLPGLAGPCPCPRRLDFLRFAKEMVCSCQGLPKAPAVLL